MNVLILTHNYPRWDGDTSGIFLTHLIERLPQHGIKPVVLAPHDNGTAERETVRGIPIVRFCYGDDASETIAYRGNMQEIVLGSPRGLFRFRHFLKRFERAARDQIREQQIDVVAGHWLIPTGMVMKRLLKNNQMPMILSSHGTDVRLARKLPGPMRFYFRSLFRHLSAWTVVSSYLARSIDEIDATISPRVEVLPLPHDSSLFWHDESLPVEHNHVVAVTRFTRQKRVDQLIHAWSAVREHHPEARLTIYGSGPERSAIDQLVTRLNLGQSITLAAPVAQPELRTIYSQAAAVVLNSVGEGFGLALSEAQLCGAAVIGTESGGIPDIIASGETGLLVPPDDPAALASAISRLLEDRTLRDQLARSGRDSARQRYLADPLAARYAGLLQAAVG